MHLFFLMVMVLLSCVLNSENTHSPPKRTATISSAYAERLSNSNEGLVDFPLSVIEGYGAFFDYATGSFNDSVSSRAAISLIELPTLSFWLTHALFVPYHEFGHARAMKALGGDYSYGTSGFGKKIGGLSNFWSLSAFRIFTPPFFWPGAGGAITKGRKIRPALNNALLKHWGRGRVSIVITGAGLNN